MRTYFPGLHYSCKLFSLSSPVVEDDTIWLFQNGLYTKKIINENLKHSPYKTALFPI